MDSFVYFLIYQFNFKTSLRPLFSAVCAKGCQTYVNPNLAFNNDSIPWQLSPINDC